MKDWLMDFITHMLFYSQLIDNASHVLCSLWDPQANGMSKTCSCI